MTEKEDMLSDANLQNLFAEARNANPLPSEALQSRLIADAMSEHRTRQAKTADPKMTGLEKLFGWLAWPTGLTAACAAGLWIGWSSGSDLALTLDDVWISSVGEEIAYRLPGLAGTVAGY